MGLWKIGRLARAARVNIQTIRYYERRRLLSPAERTESGYRLYGPGAVRVLRFIRNAQELGFSLNEIGRLMRLRVGKKARYAAIRAQAEERRGAVRDKIRSLRAMEGALNGLIRACSAHRTTEGSPILESLDRVL